MKWTVNVLADPEALAAVTAPANWPALSARDLVEQGPDLSLVATDGESVGARCSLWWRETPQFEGHCVGAIGHYAASNADAASALLAEACRTLEERGCRLAVGPMDGNTWRKYRFVVERGVELPFLMEPTNPDEWPGHFVSAGFVPLAHYTSGLNTDLSVRDERARAVAARLAERGVTVRTLRLDDFEGELERIYAVAEQAFTHNFLFTPITQEQFSAQYRASLPAVVPELVFIAEQESRPVGFCFSIPDLLEKARTGAVHTVILKTVAILPDRAVYGGLGSLMIDRTHETAARLGFTRVIHALMHETNQSQRISARSGSTMRRYALFSRPLASVRA